MHPQPLSQRRSWDWLKTKCWAEGEFVVIGIEPAKDGPPVALLARETDNGLEYAGGEAITLAQPDRFWREAKRLDRSGMPGLRVTQSQHYRKLFERQTNIDAELAG